MEKWKIGIIVLLLAALGGYGFYQQGVEDNPTPQPPNPNQPTPPPANPKITALKGKTPPAWNFDPKYWVNTPKPISLADTKGHVTLIEFWRMGCSHCQEAAPFMNALYQQYSPRGVMFVAIHAPGAPDQPGQPNPENNWGAVKQTIKEWGLKYPIAFDEGGQLFKKTYGADTYPAMLVLNKQGKVVHTQSGHTPQKEMELRQVIEQQLKAK
jgi:thiol-disulfide isomerase/thioredoxin